MGEGEGVRDTGGSGLGKSMGEVRVCGTPVVVDWGNPWGEVRVCGTPVGGSGLGKSMGGGEGVRDTGGSGLGKSMGGGEGVRDTGRW